MVCHGGKCADGIFIGHCCSKLAAPSQALKDYPQQIAVTQPETPSASPQENTMAATEKQSDPSTGASTKKWQALKVTIPSADGTSEQTVQVPLVAADEQKLKTMMEKQEPLLSDVALEALPKHRARSDATFVLTIRCNLKTARKQWSPWISSKCATPAPGNDNGFRHKAATVGRASSQRKEFFQCKGI